MKILMADDDSSMRLLVKTICEGAGYSCRLCSTGLEALESFDLEHPDVVILDVMMPDLDGFEVCRQIRARDDEVPIIFLSAKGDIVDKKVGFSLGGDDYLVKPFNGDELIMRIKALVRRTQRFGSAASGSANVSSQFKMGPFEFDLLKHAIRKDGMPIVFTPKEFQILSYLAQHAGMVISKGELIEMIWGKEYVDGAISIAVYVRKIREKIEDTPAKPNYLKTVWGVGYSFDV